MNYAAADLRRQGVAVWNLEYRGVDRPGGGYPGTFTDVADGADAARALAKARGLDLTHVVVVGHSAGGHLALWLAARGGIDRASALYRKHPLPIAAAFSLGGLPDLEAEETPPEDTCGAAPVARLVGAATAARPDVFADTSPAALPTPRARIVLVNADLDTIAPPTFADAYVARMRRRGAAPETHVVEGEGHVELISPGSRGWTLERGLIEAALQRPITAHSSPH
jgi:acetyl esterase/lipase